MAMFTMSSSVLDVETIIGILSISFSTSSFYNILFFLSCIFLFWKIFLTSHVIFFFTGRYQFCISNSISFLNCCQLSCNFLTISLNFDFLISSCFLFLSFSSFLLCKYFINKSNSSNEFILCHNRIFSFLPWFFWKLVPLLNLHKHKLTTTQLQKSPFPRPFVLWY